MPRRRSNIGRSTSFAKRVRLSRSNENDEMRDVRLSLDHKKHISQRARESSVDRTLRLSLDCDRHASQRARFSITVLCSTTRAKSKLPGGLSQLGNLREAESVLEKALVKSRRANSVWTNILLLLLGKIALKQGEHAKSEKLYMELAQNLGTFFDTSPAVERLRLWTSIDLAQLYTETKDYKKAEEHFLFSLFTLEAMSVGEKDYQWAVETLYHVLDGYAELLTLAGRYDDALTNRRKAHQLCLTLYGQSHVKLIRSLNELGRIYTYQGRDDDAISCFGKAIEMCKRLDGVDPMELAALLVNSGRVHLRRGLVAKAREHCQQAFVISGKQGNKLGLEHAKECLEGVKNAMK